MHDQPRLVYDPYTPAFSPDAEDDKTLSQPQVFSQADEDLRYHPFSTVVLAFWVVFIGITVWLLESAVTNAPLAIHQPWHLRVLPSLFLTVFAQGHSAVTAIHLARLGVSALQSRQLAPRTWVELFWLADGNYQGPTGIATVVVGMCRARTLVSKTFLLFSITSIISLLTPLVTDRAYPTGTVDVRETVTLRPSVLSVPLLSNTDPNQFEVVGSGGWASGMSVLDLYNTSVYTPAGTVRDEALSDFVFASDVSGFNLTIAAVRAQGSCSPFEDVSITTLAEFTDLCTSSTYIPFDPATDILINETFSITFHQVSVFGAWCSRFPNDTSALKSNGFVWLNSTNTTASLAGVVQYSSQMLFGNASVQGAKGSFDLFSDQTPNVLSHVAGQSVGEPFLVALGGLSSMPDFTDPSLDATFRAYAEQVDAGAMTMLGYSTVDIDSSGVIPLASLDTIASSLWRGATHMTAAVNLLARTTDLEYITSSDNFVSGRKRDDNFAFAALGLLILWTIMLTYCTIRMFRPTFGDSLSSYVPARLALDRPEVVGAHRSGQLSDNGHLRHRFGYVDKSSAQVVVHTH
jgi:hypothetical protein